MKERTGTRNRLDHRFQGTGQSGFEEKRGQDEYVYSIGRIKKGRNPGRRTKSQKGDSSRPCCNGTICRKDCESGKGQHLYGPKLAGKESANVWQRFLKECRKLIRQLHRTACKSCRRSDTIRVDFPEIIVYQELPEGIPCWRGVFPCQIFMFGQHIFEKNLKTFLKSSENPLKKELTK